MNDSKIRTAFILGAGLATRLRPLTEKLPKPLLPGGGLVPAKQRRCVGHK